MKSKIEKFYIYKITNPIGEVYIGQTNNYKRRQLEYAECEFKGQKKIRRSIISHGWLNHKFEVLCTCTIEEVNAKEKEYITEYNSYYKGLNSTRGNSGVRVGRKQQKSHKRNLVAQILKELKLLVDASFMTPRPGEIHLLKGCKQSIADKVGISYEQLGRIIRELVKKKTLIGEKGSYKVKGYKDNGKWK